MPSLETPDARVSATNQTTGESRRTAVERNRAMDPIGAPLTSMVASGEYNPARFGSQTARLRGTLATRAGKINSFGWVAASGLCTRK